MSHDSGGSSSSIIEPWASTIHNSPDKVLVEFMAPWCGHCRAIAQDWTAVVSELDSKNVKTVQFNCDQHRDECGYGYSVTGYPTFKLFQNGKEITYNNRRSKEDLIKWALETTPSETFTAGKIESGTITHEPLVQPHDLSYHGVFAKHKVVELTQNDVIEMTSKGFWLILFHLGSEYDKGFMPKYIQAIEKLGDDGFVGLINFGICDGYKHPIVTPHFGITSFPTVGVINDGKLEETKMIGSRKTTQDLVEYALYVWKKLKAGGPK